MTRTRALVVAGIVASLVAGAALVLRWRADRPPYAAAALRATAAVHAVTDDEAQAFLGTTVTAPRIGAAGRLVAATLHWREPPAAGGRFSVYLLDKRTRRKPALIVADDAGAVAGSESWDAAVATRYRWLQGAGPVYTGGSWWDTGCDLTVAPAATSTSLVAVFPDQVPAPAPPIELSDLLIGLAFVGDDGHVCWATRLYG